MFVGAFFIAEAMKGARPRPMRVAAATAVLARGPTSLMMALSATAFVLSMMTNERAASTAIVLPIALAASEGTWPPLTRRRWCWRSPGARRWAGWRRRWLTPPA
ncbi:MAG: hypothetical protein HS111_17705 [Kofleriaceae bacterium]|nr:hypothetical protein [Kofleriaceae bacterium]